jgi:hypothetical protein
VHGQFSARRDEAQRRSSELPRRRPGRDRLQPLERVFEVTNRESTARSSHRRPRRARRPRDGSAQRAHVPGLARRLSADRPARLLLLLRGLHPHHRFDVQPARQVAEGDARIPWRRPIASLNYLLTSHVWRQDHNGFSHQDPGFIDHVVNKKGRSRARLSAAGRQHAAVGHRPLPAQPQLRQRDRGRQAAGAAVADMDEAIKHCTAGIGIWEWASNDEGGEPDV